MYPNPAKGENILHKTDFKHVPTRRVSTSITATSMKICCARIQETVCMWPLHDIGQLRIGSSYYLKSEFSIALTSYANTNRTSRRNDTKNQRGGRRRY